MNTICSHIYFNVTRDSLAQNFSERSSKRALNAALNAASYE